MIIGIGTDIVHIPHFQKALDKMGEAGIQRLFTQAEQDLAKARPAQTLSTYAKRFAAKEAVAKAFGTGIGTLTWTEIEVVHNDKGAPQVQLYGKAAELLEKCRGKLHLSLSDDGEYAQAFVILESNALENVPPHPVNP